MLPAANKNVCFKPVTALYLELIRFKLINYYTKTEVDKHDTTMR